MPRESLKHYDNPEWQMNGNFDSMKLASAMQLDPTTQSNGQYVYHMDAQWRIYAKAVHHVGWKRAAAVSAL